MSMSNKWCFSLLVLGLAAAASLAASPAPRGLVVHEWGTFSTFSGSDGTNLEFQPYDNDLPEFVHGYLPRASKAGPRGGTISLETPVLYFYSEKALTASVQVDFPKGTLTEWYPQANRTEKRLVWRGLSVLPREEVKLPREKFERRYYAARETEANPLRAASTESTGAGAEQEKFLFYRGVGSFAMPLSARAARDGTFTVRWAGKALDGDLILLRVQGGKIRFQPFRLDQPLKDAVQGEVRVPTRDGTAAALGEALVKLLMEKGLFEKEARAMVKTWSSAWFGEEGTRVLYLLPDRLTEELLPLRLEPKPTSLVRVLVGRHDILTPDREKQIDFWVAEAKRNTKEPDAQQRVAWAELNKLGRYHGAAWRAAEARLKSAR